ncbi:MAG: methyl-accepting chemotaxis protein [Roseburia sp.]|nr:methyl-accepting chemotaxis protein [Roseburia sp.]
MNKETPTDKKKLSFKNPLEKLKKPKKTEKPKKTKKEHVSKDLPKPVAFVLEKAKTAGAFLLRLIRLIPTLLPRKAEKDAPLLDGNVKILPQFCIQTKLIGCFIIPVIMIIILGVVSYSRSSGALNENYEAAVSQTMNMAKEYFSFVFTNIESDMNVYLSDEELSAYYSGQYSTNEAQKSSVSKLKKQYDDASERLEGETEGSLAYYRAYKEKADAEKEYEDAKDVVQNAEDLSSEAYKSLNASVSNKVAANQFIGNIYIFKDGADIISSQTKLRSTNKESSDDEDINSDTLGLYKAFLESSLGKSVTGDTMSYHWCGPIPELDKILSVEDSDYILRVGHDVSSTTDAVMIVDVSRKAIMNILNDLNLGEGSYVGIVTEDAQELTVKGKALTSDTENEEEKNDEDTVVEEKIYSEQDFYKKALEAEEESGSDYVRYDGKSYLFTYQKIGTSNIMLCSLVPESVIVSQANSIRIVTIIMVLISCVIAMVVGTLISQGFSKSINKSIKELEKVSKGDLTVEFRTNRRDEFALLYGSCNDMLANIRSLILEVESVYDALTVSLNKVDSSSSTFTETTKDIQHSVHEMETGISEQSESAAACLTDMDSLFNKINTVNDDTNEIGNIAASTQVAIQTGLTSMDNLNDKTKSTTEITDNVIQTIKQLSVHSMNIKQIVNSINDIAEETNLLSLNASIEAARAGTAGKGFSVVANQIRKLADQCLASAGKISNIVNEITIATEDAVATAQNAEEIVDEQVEAVGATAQSFQSLKTHIEHLTEYLESIQNSSKDMETAGSSTLNSMENISAILEQTLASISSVANVTDKQSAALTSLDDASSQLMVRADRLGDAISKFKTK